MIEIMTHEGKMCKSNLNNSNSSMNRVKGSKLNKIDSYSVKKTTIADFGCGSLPTDSYLLSNRIEMSKCNIDVKVDEEERGFCSLIAAKKEKKKFVRFADSLGLDLVSIQFIKEINYQSNESSNETISMVKPSKPQKQKQYLVLIPCFTLLAKHFYNDNLQFNCKLFDYLFDNEGKILKFLIRVKNLSYQKHVFVRFTLNSWKSFTDIDAFFTNSASLKKNKQISNIVDSNSEYDNFICVLSMNHCLTKEETNQFLKFEFAVCYQSSKDDYHWDNNNGSNFLFQCFFPKA
jgi:hypothetical protein